MTRLIGLNGFKTSGKDSTYSAIKAALPSLVVQRVAFADPLKVFAARALGIEEKEKEQMEWLKENGEVRLVDRSYLPFSMNITGRQYLQNIGAAARDVFADDFWISQALPLEADGLERKYPDADVIVVTDVRYENEAKRIRHLGGEMWEVVRPGTSSDGHITEIPLPKHYFAHVVHNTGNLSELHKAVGEILLCG